MAISILNARVWTKFLPGLTAVPTVPTAIDHNDPAWLTTDIYNSELALNESGILYTRYGSIQRLNRIVTVGDPISGVATSGQFLYDNAGVVGFRSIEAATDIEYQMSITADASGLKFVNDQTSPGNSKFYGTTSLGVKGWRKIKKADVDDLNAYQLLFGAQDASGNIEQSPHLTWEFPGASYSTRTLWLEDVDNNVGGFLATSETSSLFSIQSNTVFTVGNLVLDASYASMQAGILSFGNSSTNGITFSVGAAGASHNLVFPGNQGAANTFLKNDGSGNLSWVTIAESPSFLNGNSTTWNGNAYDLGGTMTDNVTITGGDFTLLINNTTVDFANMHGFSVYNTGATDISLTSETGTIVLNGGIVQLQSDSYVSLTAGSDIILTPITSLQFENISQDDTTTKILSLDGNNVHWRDFSTFTGTGGTVTSVDISITNTGGIGATIVPSGGPITSSGTISINIPDAGSGVLRGVVTNGIQTFEGAKTFNNTVNFNDDATFVDVAWFGSNKTKINSSGQIYLYNSATPDAGSLLKGNGTIFDNFSKGTAGQLLRVNVGGTDIEWFTHSFQAEDATLTSIAAVSGVQGDLLYASGTDTWTRLAKDTNATRYLSNTGTSNNPAWAQVDLTTGISGFGTGVATFLATPSSANLRTALTDENGTGALLFSGATSPSFAGTVAMASATFTGKVTTYNNIATANNGLGMSVGTPVHLTGQSSAIGATTMHTTDADGFYMITVQLAITTTGGTTIGCQIKFTNQADNVVKTMPSNNQNGMNQCASTSTGNAICYTVVAYCKTNTNIQYVTNLAGSGQQYSLDAFVFKL